MALLAAAFLLGGCGGGEILPLEPATGTCDRPPDPRWRVLAPLRGQELYRDAVWPDQETVWVVGTGGLALVKRGAGPFRREDTGADGDLAAAFALADGTVGAVGEGGTVAERQGDRWTVRQVAGVGALRRAAAVGQQAWAVGDSGAVVQRDAAGVWTRLDPPAPGDLRGVAATADTVAVCGTGGALWLRTEGGWRDLSAGPWLTDDLHSVVWLADGRLVVGSRYAIYVRGANGWVVPVYSEAPPSDTPWRRLQVAGGSLWCFGYWNLDVYDTGGPVWTGDRISDNSWGSVAVRDPGTALLVNSTDLGWLADGILESTDPADYDGDDLFSLADGTCGCFDSWGLLVTGPGGLRRAVTLPDDARAALGGLSAVTGQSLDDFHAAGRYAVWRFAQGVGAPVVEIPSGSSLGSMVQGQDGRLHLSLDGDLAGVFTAEGGVLQQELATDSSYSGLELSLTRQGTAVARWNSRAWIFRDAAWDSLAFPARGILAEPVAGELVALETDGYFGRNFRIWREGQGLPAEEWVGPVPLCPDLDFRNGADSSAGLFLYTDYPSLVVAPQTDRLDGPWDLVAGPLDGEIGGLKVMADGSLLATTWNPRTLVIYPAR